MNYLSHELQHLKTELVEMGQLVLGQLEKGTEALLRHDRDCAHEIIVNEKRVNSYELSLDRMCANILALYNPVAVDLRFVLAVLKITSSLERIADNLESVAHYTLAIEKPFDKKLLDALNTTEMFAVATEMLHKVLKALETENPKMAREVFKQDKLLDEWNIAAPGKITAYIKSHPDNIEPALALLSIFRKLERVGDQTKNMGEEIIYYVKAKVVKHRRNREEKKKD
jgi:phosphate transport system protein